MTGARAATAAGAAPSIRLTQIKLPLDHLPQAIEQAVQERLNIQADHIVSITIFRRGVDARKRSDVHFIYTLDVVTRNSPAILATVQQRTEKLGLVTATPDTTYRFVTRAPERDFDRPVVVGSGPCGLFAALTLAQMGFRPLILERGKIVRERTKDTWGFWRNSQLKPESNVQFGEGGAGTFSDGKLWSQVKDPQFHGRKVLLEMVRAGAPEEIMYVSKPHVGTFRLVKVVEFLRREIIRLGGEYRFNSKVTDLQIEQAQVRGLILEDGTQIDARHVVLAIGHSARDTFEMLHRQRVYIEAKSFSVGFRIEHPQSLIDEARLGAFAGNSLLGSADYKLVHHASNKRSVYTFCMCPGGTVVAASSEPDRVVTNGMSQYSRNERNANAGIVVGIQPADFDFGTRGEVLATEHDRSKALAGVRFQRALESAAFVLGGQNYEAPGQRVGDFLKSVASTQLGSVVPSYQPGVHLTDLGNPANPSLPMYAIAAIREAIPEFARQIRGFDLADAMLTGVETRTSSPIRIARFDERAELAKRFQSLNTEGLFPAGEGAGYAGGIMSAAIDGIKIAEVVGLNIVAQLSERELKQN
jgi:uncharacterized protein